MDVPDFWKRVRLQTDKLRQAHPSGCVPLCSIENATSRAKGGVVSWATAEVAAKCLVEGTHREAIDAEVAQLNGIMDANRRTMEATEVRLHVQHYRAK